MAQQVTMSAALTCSFGATPATMVVTPEKMVNADNKPAANIMDYTPMKNIPTFGMCSAPTNPAVIAATSAALGVFTPAPCIPNTVAPWVPGATKVMIKNMPALSSSSTCQCMWLGMISVTYAGQVKVNVT
jgi:hypothetical protein